MKNTTSVAPPMNQPCRRNRVALYGARNDELPRQPGGDEEHRDAGEEGGVGNHRDGLLERLIDAEVRHLQPERIHADEGVRHAVAQHEVHVRDVRLRLRSCRVPGRVEHLLEVDRGLEGRRRQLAQADVLHDDVDLVG